jgi:ribosome-associated protein
VTPEQPADGLAVGRGRTAFVVPDTALSWRFSRASGPGGQGVNTTDSRVELSLDVSTLPEAVRERVRARLANRLVGDVLTIVAAEHRSQLRNRDAARRRLAALLTGALAPDPPKRRPSKPSKSARARRMDEKTRRGQVKRLRGRPDE